MKYPLSDYPVPAAETVTKLDAARRQLATAIELWFYDKDQVSIHTLSFAAYEIVHDVSRIKGRKQTLIFDTPFVKKKYRGTWSAAVKRTARFLKHGEHDPDGIIEFQPISSEIFIVFAIIGLGAIGVSHNDHEFAFTWWFIVNRPEMLTQEGRDKFAELFPVNAIAKISDIPKAEFFETALEVRRRATSSI